uniref:Double-strand break repair protein n=1 Tax=Caenorhabditis japonica TaxID=281687 RepID=A0A8R1DTR1_CAEJA
MCGDNDSFDEEVADSNNDSQRPDAEHDTMVDHLVDEEEERTHHEVDDVIRILVATDIHCGYGENKPNIHMDAVNTFEEVLQIATEQKVDMVLLGGDLYHENNPSREVQHRVTQLLRQYCLNENPIALEFLSDASINFNQSVFGHVNYYDQNLNVGLPIFTIHGNHDDLSGKGLSALDLLHEAGLVNLFGKHNSVQEFTVSPILLRKGGTLLALYGLGSQRDDRLVRAFKDQNITFFRPSAGAEDWFNLFVLHQNRPRRAMHRSTGNFLPESLIPHFFDLLVWGHEHECKPDPQYVASSEAVGDGFYILQPGSTVATSLTAEEALQKNVFLLKIKGRKFASKPIPLKTVRPMIVDELVLDKIPPGCKPTLKTERPKRKDGRYVDELAIEAKLNEMIGRAKANRRPTQPELPLIRLKVTYDADWLDVTPANAKRIGLRYESQVANAADMVVIRKNTKSTDSKGKKQQGNSKGDDISDELGHVSVANLQNIINDYFSGKKFEERMTVLKPSGIGKALEHYSEIDEGVTAAAANRNFDATLTNQIEHIRTALKQMPLPPIDSLDDLEAFQDLIAKDLMDLKRADYERTAGVSSTHGPMEVEDEDEDSKFYMPVVNNTEPRKSSFSVRADDDEDEVLVDSDEDTPSYLKTTKTTRGRGARGKAATRGRATAKKNIRSMEVDEDEYVMVGDSPSPPPPSQSTRGRGRGRSAGTKKRDLSFF